MISIVFTCKGRPALTELCLRRLVELMPQPYELLICCDRDDETYFDLLSPFIMDIQHIDFVTIHNDSGGSRFELINKALELAKGEFFMHVENDFYWVDPACLDAALNAFEFMKEPLDYIRFEQLPFTYKNFYHYQPVDGKDICWMRDASPYRFTFNPHIRKFKYPTDTPFPTDPNEWESRNMQDEAYMNQGYLYQSACMTGDNWRHLGVYSEGGHYKPHYGERFFNVRGKTAQYPDEYLVEFSRLTKNPLYVELFKRHLNDNRNKHST